MPELPEMENYRRLLSERLIHEPITKVEINRIKSINVQKTVFTEQVSGQSIQSITRRGKYLLFHLTSGHSLLLHLMLGGFMFYGTEAEQPKRSKQIILSFQNEHLYFVGLRLGFLHLHSLDGLKQALAKLGPEPLDPDFTLTVFLKRLKQRRGKLKACLINQQMIAGIGNCYADEICFSAQVLPFRKVTDLTTPEKERLFNSMKAVLAKAISCGGYMQEPVYKGDRLTGSFRSSCNVYDRTGNHCSRCGSAIQQDELSSRKMFYCSGCQV